MGFPRVLNGPYILSPLPHARAQAHLPECDE